MSSWERTAEHFCLNWGTRSSWALWVLGLEEEEEGEAWRVRPPWLVKIMTWYLMFYEKVSYLIWMVDWGDYEDTPFFIVQLSQAIRNRVVPPFPVGCVVGMFLARGGCDQGRVLSN